MKAYLANWNFMRMLRFVLGIFIITQGVTTGEWLFAIAGTIFSLMAIFNIGCYGVSSCSTPVSKSDKKIEDINYEEVK